MIGGVEKCNGEEGRTIPRTYHIRFATSRFLAVVIGVIIVCINSFLYGMSMDAQVHRDISFTTRRTTLASSLDITNVTMLEMINQKQHTNAPTTDNRPFGLGIMSGRQPTQKLMGTTKGEIKTFFAQYKKTQIYAWQHIPKAGGTSAYKRYMNFLSDNKYNATVFPPPNMRYDWNSPGCKDSLSYGGTHCSQSEIKSCLINNVVGSQNADDIKFLTFIRNPIDRVISEYYYWRGQTGTTRKGRPRPITSWTESMCSSRNNFTAWILDDSNVAHNRQSFYFLLNGVEFPKRGQGECIPYVGKKTINLIQKRFGSTMDMNNIQLPDDILDRFSFVGLLENFTSSDRLFEKTFGMKLSNNVGQESIGEWDRHASKKPLDIEEHVLNLIRERNKLDMKLYNKVLEMHRNV